MQAGIDTLMNRMTVFYNHCESNFPCHWYLQSRHNKNLNEMVLATMLEF